ncbi:MAG: phosphoribosylamine--glycine ligase [Alphaproteobacteria bacterium]|nr:MAG: phosphoribosylamine--glycine ligase [Alphaproteobacteria bacterium]
MVFGVGAYAQGLMQLLQGDGAEVSAYLTRSDRHYPPTLSGTTYSKEQYPNPCELLEINKPDFIVPMSIDWHTQEWTTELIKMDIPVFSPVGKGIQLESNREFSHELCNKYGIAFPASYMVHTAQEAEDIVKSTSVAYVIKNPLCSPSSPVQAMICETVEDTLDCLKTVDCSEGLFLQEYVGKREVGHVVFVSDGEIHSLITNQEYKRAFSGDMGVTTSIPLGGLAEQDPDDKYGLAKELIHPLLPWLKEVGFKGAIQVTAALHKGKWHVLEYNVRIGATCTAMLLPMLINPTELMYNVARSKPIAPQFHKNMKFSCSLALVGYGYPYVSVANQSYHVKLKEKVDCDMWWDYVAEDQQGCLHTTGQRIADIVATENTLDAAIIKAYKNIRKIQCYSSYYRTDIGQSKWPPGEE